MCWSVGVPMYSQQGFRIPVCSTWLFVSVIIFVSRGSEGPIVDLDHTPACRSMLFEDEDEEKTTTRSPISDLRSAIGRADVHEIRATSATDVTKPTTQRGPDQGSGAEPRVDHATLVTLDGRLDARLACVPVTTSFMGVTGAASLTSAGATFAANVTVTTAPAGRGWTVL